MPGTTDFLRPWLFTICASLALFGSAQEPLAPTGKVAEVLTASQGVYPEVFANDTIRKIGSFLFNTRTRKAYRFGFQGQEKDDEIYGAAGTSYAFEYRMHDARVGRFWSIDPLVQRFPWWSPYQFAGNTPIAAAELEGKEPDIKFESPHSSQMIGGEGLDKDAYDEAFNRLVLIGISAVAADAGLGWLSYFIRDNPPEPSTPTPKQGTPNNNPRTPSSKPKIEKVDAQKIEVTSTGKTKSGEVRVNAQQGEKRLDITATRVKEYVPEPRNPGTGERQVNYETEGLPEGSEIIPGSKGLKRTPTAAEQQLIEAAKSKSD